jgi:hypothetical protein
MVVFFDEEESFNNRSASEMSSEKSILGLERGLQVK